MATRFLIRVLNGVYYSAVPHSYAYEYCTVFTTVLCLTAVNTRSYVYGKEVPDFVAVGGNPRIKLLVPAGEMDLYAVDAVLGCGAFDNLAIIPATRHNGKQPNQDGSYDTNTMPL